MIKPILLLLWLFVATVSVADQDHIGHSDILLLLLKDKIALQKLIKQYPDLSGQAQAQNQKEQRVLFKHAFTLLQDYVATPESQYPNMSMYHDSLKSRAALMNDFLGLMIDSQCKQDPSCR